MAVRQYIGARYVPTYYQNSLDPTSSEWEANVSYDPLTIVSLPNLHSYQSKKFVPSTIGSPASNPEYWYDQGYANVYYQALQDQIDDMKDGTVPGSLQEQISDNTSDIADLAKYGTNGGILVIGNSYVAQGCALKIESLFKHVYEKLGGGFGFVPYTGHSVGYEERLDNAIADPDIINTNITHVLFISAMGDTRALVESGTDSYKSQLASTLSSMKTKIANNFPNCKHMMVSFAESRNVASFSDNQYDALFNIHKIFTEYCAANDYWYMGWSGFNILFNSGDFEADHYHPNSAGASIIGQFIKDSFLGKAEYKSLYSQKTGATIGYTADSTATVQTKLLPNEASIYIRNISGSGAVTVGANDTFLDLTQLPIPVPAPYGSIDIIADMRTYSPSYQIKDTLRLTVDGGSNGVAIIKNVYNPIASTMDATLKCEALGRLTYII